MEFGNINFIINGKSWYVPLMMEWKVEYEVGIIPENSGGVGGYDGFNWWHPGTLLYTMGNGALLDATGSY